MKPNNLTELLRTVLRDSPRATEAEARELCWQKCAVNAELMKSLFDYWFGNSFRDFAVVGGSQFSTAVVSIKQERRQRGTREQINKLKDRMKVCLMDLVLSDGTPLRFATFGQCIREGSWFAAIGRMGKANEVVGKKLKEADLQNIRTRFSTKKAA